MENGRYDICVLGNLIVDSIHDIHGYPPIGELTTILSETRRRTGGAVCNVAMDLARLDPALRICVKGRIGNDANGAMLLEGFRPYPSIDTGGIYAAGETSYTIVMNDIVTKQRSFFHFRGANGQLCEEDLDVPGLDCGVVHAGYLLLLDELDGPDAEFGSRMARLLHHLKQRGIRTSVDMVSEIGTRARDVVPYALRWTDYCIINETEASAVTGIPLRTSGGRLLRGNMERALRALKACGVSAWAVVHCPEGGFGLDEKGAFYAVASPDLPEGYIRGTVGAGDAFCAGVLYGACRKWPLMDSIELGTATAVSSLSAPGATEGVGGMADVLAAYRLLKHSGARRTRPKKRSFAPDHSGGS